MFRRLLFFFFPAGLNLNKNQWKMVVSHPLFHQDQQNKNWQLHCSKIETNAPPLDEPSNLVTTRPVNLNFS